MLIDLFFQNPGVGFAWLAVIIIALSVHEFSHAMVAHMKGDPTAEQHGRLTLNPFAHLDPVGLIPLFLFGFGWAKPVPYNPYQFKNPRFDSLMVALAGPGSNLVLAVLAGAGYRILQGIGGDFGLLPMFLLIAALVNLLLLFFNMVPVYPLDGSKILDAVFIKQHHQAWLIKLKVYGPQILFVLVLISIFTQINAFFFVSVPAELACYGLTGESCLRVISAAL